MWMLCGRGMLSISHKKARGFRGLAALYPGVSHAHFVACVTRRGGEAPPSPTVAPRSACGSAHNCWGPAASPMELCNHIPLPLS